MRVRRRQICKREHGRHSYAGRQSWPANVASQMLTDQSAGALCVLCATFFFSWQIRLCYLDYDVLRPLLTTTGLYLVVDAPYPVGYPSRIRSAALPSFDQRSVSGIFCVFWRPQRSDRMAFDSLSSPTPATQKAFIEGRIKMFFSRFISLKLPNFRYLYKMLKQRYILVKLVHSKRT